MVPTWWMACEGSCAGMMPETRVFCFQAEDGIRYKLVTGVQTCALPIDRKSTRLKQPMLFQLGEPVRDFRRRVMRQALLQQIRVRLAVDQTENAALLGGQVRIAQLPR